MSIEESIQQIETLIEAWQLDEADLNQTDINAMQVLLKEKQELKEQLDKYENPEDMTLMMMWCTEKVKDENQALKKQLHEASITIQEMVEQDIECPSNCEKLRILKKQHEKLLNDYCRLDARKYSEQEEFIKYMNSCIKELEKESTNKLQNTINLAIKDIAKIILQKYKGIIGGTKDE